MQRIEGKLSELNIKPDKAFKLESESGEAYWVRLKKSRKTVEGKLFLPAKKATELIIFTPGFPGNGVKWFEEKHAGKMVKAGYAVLVLRNNGIYTRHEKSGNYVNCPERAGYISEKLGEYIGNSRETSFKEWGNQPHTAIRALKDSFDKIHLIGHSFGGMTTAVALAREPEKVESWIGLSPAMDDFSNNADSRAAKDSLRDGVRSFNSTILPGMTEKSVEEWVRLAKELHRNAGNISPKARLLVYTPVGDEYVGLKGINSFMQKAGGREVRGFRYIEKRIPKTSGWKEIHDFRDLKPEELIQFIRGKRKAVST